jgi:hypothetical protein
MMEDINLAIDNPCQVLAVPHHPGDLVPVTRLFGPVTVFLGVLFDQDRIGEAQAVRPPEKGGNQGWGPQTNTARKPMTDMQMR